MKGAASSVGDEPMSWFCHGLEERLRVADYEGDGAQRRCRRSRSGAWCWGRCSTIPTRALDTLRARRKPSQTPIRSLSNGPARALRVRSRRARSGFDEATATIRVPRRGRRSPARAARRHRASARAHRGRGSSAGTGRRCRCASSGRRSSRPCASSGRRGPGGRRPPPSRAWSRSPPRSPRSATSSTPPRRASAPSSTSSATASPTPRSSSPRCGRPPWGASSRGSRPRSSPRLAAAGARSSCARAERTRRSTGGSPSSSSSLVSSSCATPSRTASSRPTLRTALGKPPSGTIALAARKIGNRLSLTIEDDGAGVDVAEVRARARRRGAGDAGHRRGGRRRHAPRRSSFCPASRRASRATCSQGEASASRSRAAACRGWAAAIRLSSRAGEGFSARIDVPIDSGLVTVLWVTAGADEFAHPGREREARAPERGRRRRSLARICCRASTARRRAGALRHRSRARRATRTPAPCIRGRRRGRPHRGAPRAAAGSAGGGARPVCGRHRARRRLAALRARRRGQSPRAPARSPPPLVRAQGRTPGRRRMARRPLAGSASRVRPRPVHDDHVHDGIAPRTALPLRLPPQLTCTCRPCSFASTR